MQRMIMESYWKAFESCVSQWTEIGWTVVPNSQGCGAAADGVSWLWVWLQEPKDPSDEITLDIYP